MKIYDTTLRDGAQWSDVNLSVDDKLRIFDQLVDIGIHYIEGGWPGANPKDDEFFEKIKSQKIKIKGSKLSAFGCTRRSGQKAEEDILLKALVKSGTPVITVFGKTWDLHVGEALHVSLSENLEMIFDSIQYLKKHADEVFFDAEHFFDGYKANPKYALKVLKIAEQAGADCLVLCDTNGGTLPFTIAEILDILKGDLTADIGLHMHN